MLVNSYSLLKNFHPKMQHNTHFSLSLIFIRYNINIYKWEGVEVKTLSVSSGQQYVVKGLVFLWFIIHLLTFICASVFILCPFRSVVCVLCNQDCKAEVATTIHIPHVLKGYPTNWFQARREMSKATVDLRDVTKDAQPSDHCT